MDTAAHSGALAEADSDSVDTGRTTENPSAHAPVLTGRDFDKAGRPGERLSRFFEGLAQTFGPSTAVIDNGRNWTYAEMDAQANRFARLLAQRGVKPGDRVALLLDRAAETYVAILAVMKAGAAFVPLAPAFPEERMTLIIEDAGVSLVVTAPGYAARAGELSVPHVVIDSTSAEIAALSDAALDIAAVADDICYILYTSGTTGRPKGVAVRHQSICNFVRVAAEAYGTRRKA